MHNLVTMRSSGTVFWDVMPQSPANIGHCSEKHCLFSQGHRGSQTSNYKEGGGQKDFVCCFEMLRNF
jgi:hypothetical protein